MSEEYKDFLRENLRMWADSGVPAPVNELQSIHAWLGCLGQHGEEETKKRMRARMILLMRAVNELADEGVEAEIAAGIYDLRPDALEQRRAALAVQAAAAQLPQAE